MHSFIGHKDRINAVSAQGSVCASASADRTVKCWDLVAKVLLEGHELHRVSIYGGVAMGMLRCLRFQTGALD